MQERVRAEIYQQLKKADSILKSVREKLAPKRTKWMIRVTRVRPNRDNVVIYERDASDQIVKVIEEVGIGIVHKLGLGTSKRPLVTKSPPAPSGYRPSSDGFYIKVSSNTNDKLKYLRQMRDRLGLENELKIEDLRSCPPHESE